jgi:hypothetical protein
MRAAAGKAVVALAAVALAAVAAFGLAACGEGDGFLAAEAKTPEAADARGVLETLARDGLEALTPRLTDSLRTVESTAKLRAVVALFPKSAPTRARLVNFIQNTTEERGGGKAVTTSVAYELSYPDRYLTAQVVFKSIDAGPRRIVGLHANPMPASGARANAFAFRDKGPLHDHFFLVVSAVAVLVLAALIVRRRTRAKPGESPAAGPPSVGS